MQLVPQQTNGFIRDIKHMKKRGKNIKLLEDIVRKLAQTEKLPPKNKDHNLVGNWNGYREYHISPDWLLIYKIEDQSLTLVRTGSHSDIFG